MTGSTQTDTERKPLPILKELQRRHVFKVGVAYIVVAWVILQVSDVVLDKIDVPGWVFQVVLLLLCAGFPLVLVFAWAFRSFSPADEKVCVSPA